MLHISDGNTVYWEHSFGPAKRNFWDLPPHGDAASAIEYLRESQRPISRTLAEFDDVALDGMRPTHFGAEWRALDIFLTLILEQDHHGAEIGVLRDLYRGRDT